MANYFQFLLFGVSEYTLRLPSVVMGVVLTLTGYRVGSILVNRNTGYITSILIVSSYYLIELIAGRQELDHNDVSFITYVSLSIWSLVEYSISQNKKWIYLIGIFSGCAILCKWLVGLLVYWGWALLEFQKRKYNLIAIKHFLTAFLITMAVFIPWQVYTFYEFYDLALATYHENASHFTQILHGHSGNKFYHFEKINTIYGAYSIYLILPAFYFFYKRTTSKSICWALIGMIAAVYLFFTLAATKMPSFTAVVFLPIMVAIATLINEFLELLVSIFRYKISRHVLYIITLGILLIFRIDLDQLYSRHSDFENNKHIRVSTSNASIFKNIHLPENYILFNIPGRHFIEGMFYTGLLCYGNIPSEEQYLDLKRKGKKIAILNAGKVDIPAYLSADSETIYLEQEVEISE